MPTGRTGGASALLQRVNSQLRGERVPLKTKEEDELATYLSSLTQKTKVVSSGNFDDGGDISISSGRGVGRRSASPKAAAPVTSKFLKKKAPLVTQPEVKRSMLKDSDDEEDDDHRGQIVIDGRQKGQASAGPTRPERSSALNKANAWASKIQTRRTEGIPLRRHASRDSDSESEVGRRPGSADTSVGRDGRKFIKRKTLDEDRESPQPAQRSSSIEGKKKQGKKIKRQDSIQKEIKRTLGNVYLTSEEESLADFIQGLSVSESSRRGPQNLVAKKQQKWRKKTPTRQSPSPVQRSRSPSPFKRTPSPFGGRVSRSVSHDDSDYLDSMASEIHDVQRNRDSDSDEPLNINLMDVNSLIPASPKEKRSRSRQKSGALQSSSSSLFKATFGPTPNLLSKDSKGKKKEKKKELRRSESKTSLLEGLGIHMVDDLLDLGSPAGPDVEVDVSDLSEIVTEKSDYKAVARQDSESEIVTELGGGKRPTLVRQVSTDRSASVSEEIETSNKRRKSRKSPSSVEESDSQGGYSEDSFESDSRTISQSSHRSHSDRKSRRRRTPRDGSYSRGSRRRVVLEKHEMSVRAGDARGGTHQFDTVTTGVSVSRPFGLEYVDPAPVATHVISADALEAITGYSPSVLCLHEMMKAQVELVRNFADLQTRIYKSCLGGIKEDFKYTTLEDTKQYIQKNRKPKMTFKEAMALVAQEERMGITA